jgi:hypothetical protein
MTEETTDLVAIEKNLVGLLGELQLLVRHIHLMNCPLCASQADDDDDPYAVRH